MGHRPDKVGAAIRRIVSGTISNKLNDPRIAPLTSVTRVEVSADLQHAKVFVSVVGSDKENNMTMAALNHARGFVQSTVARGLTLRVCPKLAFVLDESIKKSMETIRIINESMEEIRRDQAEAAQQPDMPEEQAEDPDMECQDQANPRSDTE